MQSIFEQCITYIYELVAEALKDEAVVVSIGGTSIMKPAEFIVRELPQSLTFSDTVTNAISTAGVTGRYRVEFNVPFEVWSKHKELEQASFEVLKWLQMAFNAVALNKTLGGLVIHAEPYVDNGGSSLDTNKLYTVGIDCGIHVKAEIIPAVKE